MIYQRKIQLILALTVSSVFLFQNCATIIRGTTQKIPVTSNPIGAKIIVDGLEIGNAPIELKLKRKKNHLIRIEKQGYSPFEIRITRKSSLLPSILGNLYMGGGAIGGLLGSFLAIEIFEGEGDAYVGLCIGGLIGLVGAIVVDFWTGANYNLSLNNLNVTLTKIGKNAQPNFIHIDAEQFQNIKWIRIKCVDNDKEEIINLD